MRRRIPLLAAGALAALPLLGLSSPNPGVIFEITTTDHTRSPAVTDVGTLEIEGPNLAMAVDGADGEGRMIYRGDRGDMVIEDHTNGTFTTIDDEALAGLAEQMNAAMAQMEKMLESLPKEQRDALERMREQGMPGMPGMAGMGEPPETEARATGRSDTRGGYPVDEWEVLEDGVVVRQMWVTPWSEIDGGEEARDAMVGMVDFFDRFLAAMPRMPGQDGPLIRNPFRDMNMADGMPIYSAELAPDGTIERESEVTSVERRALPPETFEPNAALSERALPTVGGE